MNEKPRGTGLSPSSLATFLGCQRRYYHNKVAKTPKDSDVPEDVESLLIGSAFHKCLEDTRHILDGYGFKDVLKVSEEFKLDEDTAALIFAMLSRYKEVHAKAGLKAIACEVIVNTEKFYGIVDVILEDSSGNWWIGDMKTAASYRPDIVPTLPLHPQLNLYAAHANAIGEFLGLLPEKYLGCRYRMTTKSRIGRKGGEEIGPYVKRLSKAIKSFDFILPKELMNPNLFAGIHGSAFKMIGEAGDKEAAFPQSFSNCMNYFRPCEFWSKCHGKNFTEMMDIGVITSQ